MSDNGYDKLPEQKTLIGRMLGFCIYNKLVVALIMLFIIAWGIFVAPFDWNLGIERNPVPVDAIPDIGENQQIIFTDWPGRSPQDVQNQITYPLTTALLGIPDVKTIRSSSMFGFSSIYIIFREFSTYEKIIQGKNFYWTRSRILEKLNSLPEGTLPPDAAPILGPDATALGQIFWYTLEGRDSQGNPAGGWDLEELRTIQDWQVRLALRSAFGASEVASVGGFVREYQVDVKPDALRAFNVSIEEVLNAVQNSNIDVGAQTIELNRVEYIIRGVGFIKNVADIENSVVKVNENIPVLIKHVANVSMGPEARRGVLDKQGAEVVGGVVVARYGSNPLEVIKNVKAKIADIEPSLPTKAIIDNNMVSPQQARDFAMQNGFEAYQGAVLNQSAWLDYIRKTPADKLPDWLNTSQVKLIPFYDRTGLIYETLGTLNDALYQQILITVIVIVIAVMHLRSSILISAVMPLAVLGCFITMKIFGVDANIVSLSGIAIAIGAITDMGIVICENILYHLKTDPPDMPRAEVIHRAASEVGGSLVSAMSSTIISFVPVFFMSGPEGKLFQPLAFTKTFALLASIIVSLTIIPPAAVIIFFPNKISKKYIRFSLYIFVVVAGLAAAFLIGWIVGLAIIGFAAYYLFKDYLPEIIRNNAHYVANVAVLLLVVLLLTADWEPLGAQKGFIINLIFIVVLIGILMTAVLLFQHFYSPILRWCLNYKILFLSIPGVILLLGLMIWLGFDKVFGFVPAAAQTVGIEKPKVYSTVIWSNLSHKFPGLGKEFMPPLDEGSFLFMPTTLPHASIGESLDVLQTQDIAIGSIPEVESVVGKIGRADSALDPAPIGMIETVVNYKDEYITDMAGRRINFRYDKKAGDFARDENGELIPDTSGKPYRQWRSHVTSPDDIWKEITAAAQIPSVTSAHKLQPIAARLVMLQSGIRSALAIKIKGPDLYTIEKTGYEIEQILKQVPSIEPNTVVADRIIGKPYLEIVPQREALARYGIPIEEFQNIIEVAVGGIRNTTTVEGLQRFGVRVRYQRELRDSIEALEKILITGAENVQIPLTQVASINYVRGPEEIKSEDTILTGYVLFDKKADFAEVDVVEEADRFIKYKESTGEFIRPAGVVITFAGTYENQIHAMKTMMILVPLALFAIFMVIYFQFRKVSTTLMIFAGVMVSWAGAFLLIWLYAQPWYMNFSVFGANLRELFQVHPINLSIAVWVGFLALFGISDDDGIVMSTYLDQTFAKVKPRTIDEIRQTTITAGKRRVRAALMTGTTTILALIPIFTSTGRGSDIMVPMAIPSFGGMTIEILTMLIVPVLYCAYQEHRLKSSQLE